MIEVDLWEAQLTDASAIETDFSAAQIEGAFLTRINAFTAQFKEANLNETSFYAANLRSTSFQDALIDECDFNQAETDGAVGLGEFLK
jgi:uncharacterized protein YjbI with pentapeptide repeats